MPRETQHRQGTPGTREEGVDPHRWEARPPLQKNLNYKYPPNGSLPLVSFILSDSEVKTLVSIRDQTT